MPDIPALITKFFNLSLPAVAAIFLASGFVLLSLDTYLPFLNFSIVREQGKLYLNTAFLLSFCLLFVKFAIFITVFIRKKHKKRLIRKTLKFRLTKLTPEEKSTLSIYIKGQTRSCMLDIDNGLVTGLIKSGILYQASNHGGLHEAIFAVNITDGAWIYLNEHPELVGFIWNNDKFINKPVPKVNT